MGVAPATLLAVDDRVEVTERSLRNGHVHVTLDDTGAVTSIVSLDHDRELLRPERAVGLHVAPDHPVEYDAWNLEGWTRSLARPLSGECTIELVDGGPLVGAIAVRRTDGPSTFTTTYRLTAGSPRLDIVVEVDWHHDELLLSLVLPLDVHTDHAVCDIQLGHVRRPTHASSSWDAAKFEVCAHRFVDVAEPSFGVAVLNDGRYGHAVHDDAVQVSLLRAAKYPDPMADHGEHRVTISVLPHGAGLHDVLAEAEALNRPVRILGGGAAQEVASASVDHPGVDVDAVKGADDGSGDLVVRLHEACGDRVEVGVGLPDLVSAWRCDLFEAPLGEVPVAGGVARLPLRPFELATVRLRRAPDAVVSRDGRGD
jgi:alpha-mannosidase